MIMQLKTNWCREMVSNVISKILYKRIKKKVNIKIKDMNFDVDDQFATVNINATVTLPKEELGQLLLHGL